MNIHLDLKGLVISLVLSALLCYILKIEHPLYYALIVGCIYVGLLFLNDSNQNNNSSNNNNGHINNLNMTGHSRGATNNVTKENFGLNYSSVMESNNNDDNSEGEVQENPFKKNNNPLDGLNTEELSSKLNYLHYATSHPFTPKSYVDYRKDYLVNSKTDLKAPKSLKHVVLTNDQYPQLSENQVNFDDCMNHTSGNVLSCNQQNPSLLTDGIANKDEMNQVIREDFSPPEFVNHQNNSCKKMFENAPFNVAYNTPRDSSDDLCSNCIVTDPENVNYLL